MSTDYLPMRPIHPTHIDDMKARWAADGRDSAGVLLTHPTSCICDGCVSDANWSECKKACTQTPFGRLFGDAYQAEAERFSAGDWWGIFADDMMALEQKVVVEWSANRAANEAAVEARIAAADARLKAERVAIRVGAACTKRKAPINKIAQPCKFLYDCQGTPARPTTMRVTTECWSHEYTDPVTGAKIVKHVCDRMHPGEAGWLPQWNTDRTFKIAAPATRQWQNEAPLRRRW